MDAYAGRSVMQAGIGLKYSELKDPIRMNRHGAASAKILPSGIGLSGLTTPTTHSSTGRFAAMASLYNAIPNTFGRIQREIPMLVERS